MRKCDRCKKPVKKHKVNWDHVIDSVKTKLGLHYYMAVSCMDCKEFYHGK